jgi:hypothetical protein
MSIARPIVRDLRRRDIVAAPGQVLFDLPVDVFAAEDVALWRRVPPATSFTRLTTGFTVAAVTSFPGAARATFSVAPRTTWGAGVIIRIESRRTAERTTDVVRGGVVESVALELELDRQTTVDQELRRDVDEYRTETEAAVALYDLFDDRFLGEKTSLPALDNDGNAIVDGALVSLTGQTPTTLNGLYVRRGGVWQNALAPFAGAYVAYRYVATSGQTNFTGVDANGATLSYVPGAVLVVQNGVCLAPNAFTATNGASVVLSIGATAGHTVVVHSFGSFSVLAPIANTVLADMPQATFKGRAAGAGTGVPQDLTSAQTRTVIGMYDTRTALIAASVPASLNFVRVEGFAAVGDGGSALYKRVVSEPSHAGKAQSSDGAWWELSEVEPNVKMFGAKGDDLAIETVAFQNALGFLRQKGGTLHIPAGTYQITGQLYMDFTALTGTAGVGRYSLRGDGAGSTDIRWFGPDNTSALKIEGGAWGAGANLKITIEGFRLRDWNPSAARASVGIEIDGVIHYTQRDTAIEAFTIGQKETDLLAALFERCHWSFNNEGLVANKGTHPTDWTPPNERVYNSCHWIGNRQRGATFIKGAEIVFVGGSFEGNAKPSGGLWTEEPEQYAIKFVGSGVNGAVGPHMIGVHFESNIGLYDIWITHDDRPCTYIIDGCDFTRNGLDPRHAVNHLRFDTTGATRAHVIVRGGGGIEVNGYTPSASRRKIVEGVVTGNRHRWTIQDFVYESDTERPALPGPVHDERSRIGAFVNFQGSSGSINASYNVASVVRNGTGDFTINFQVPFTSALFPMAGLMAGAGVINMISRTASAVRILTQNLSGTATDFGETQLTIFNPGGPA